MTKLASLQKLKQLLSPEELLRVFTRTLQRQCGHGESFSRRKIGVAVSGGVDSMALAKLCSQLSSSSPESPRFKAYIVDHKRRPESSQEAASVLESLRSLELDAEILTLNWELHQNASDLPNFETVARDLRFESLGYACKRDNIDLVLFGQHHNDQEELTLLRLTQGRNPFRSPGISSLGKMFQGRAPIAVFPDPPMPYPGPSLGTKPSEPELEQQAKLPSWLKRNLIGKYPGRHPGKLGIASEIDRSRLRVVGLPTIPIAPSDIKCGRPLLDFSKEQLISFCRATGTSWVEDPSNKDVTLTPRNAIRRLLENSQLPPALATHGYMHLQVEGLRAKLDSGPGSQFKNEFFNACLFHELDLRSGTLKVTFPSPSMIAKLVRRHLPADERNQSMGFNAAIPLLLEALFNICALVSPDPSPHHIKSTTYLAALGLTMDEQAVATKPFNFGGIMVVPVDTPMSTLKDSLEGTQTLGKRTWILRREPFSRKAMQLESTQQKAPIFEINNRQWRLWDGRYWIFVDAKTSKTISVQPLDPTLLHKFRSQLSFPVRLVLDSKLSKFSGNGVHFTMPVLLADGVPFCMPTIKFMVAKFGKTLKCDIMYKSLS